MVKQSIPIKTIQFPGSENIYAFDISDQIDTNFENPTNEKIPSTKIVDEKIKIIESRLNTIEGSGSASGNGTIDNAKKEAKQYTDSEIAKLSQENGAIKNLSDKIDIIENTEIPDALRQSKDYADTYSWNTATKTISENKITGLKGLTATSLVFVSPFPDDPINVQNYYENLIYCSKQEEGTLTFASASGDPVLDLKVNITWNNKFSQIT